MHLLRFEQSLHLIGYGIVWIVAKIWRDFVGRREYGRAGPAGNVEHFLVRSLLGHLYRIDSSH